MKTEFYSILILLILVTPIQNAAFVLTNGNKHGGALGISTCNKDSLIDFGFTSNTQITCTPTGCTTTNPQQSGLRFLDVGGREELYHLQNAGTTIYFSNTTKSRTQQQGLIKLKFMSGTGRIVYVGIPFSNTISVLANRNIHQLDMDSIGDTAFNSIKTVTNFSSFSLSALNYLNQRDFGHFYHIANSATAPFETYLLSYFILNNVKFNRVNLPIAEYNFPPDNLNTIETYLATGDKLCWGAASEGIFQTHLRESYPLWASWIGILFYWLYILLTDSNDNNCYDKKFQNNKWTCWGFYSLHFLGNEDYFTKLSRTTLMLITFSWEGCVLAILYHNIPAGQGPVMILWAALIAVGTSMPFNYVLGGIFMRKIYQLTLQKYDTLKQMKGVFNKNDSKMQALEKSIDDTEQSLYGYYYWYYVVAFTLFGSFWIIAVQQMMQNHRDYYYLMHHWLASLAVAFGFEHLFFDPLLTLILGNTAFYRVRGFFYDFRLGERFKEIQE